MPRLTLQGWMGHRDCKTAEIYADFAPDPTQGAVWAQRAVGDATPHAPGERAADGSTQGPFGEVWGVRIYLLRVGALTR